MAANRKLVSYKHAIEQKKNVYYTGVPCINNHLSPRFTRNNHCVQCTTGFDVVQDHIASMARNHKAITDANTPENN